MPQLSSVFKLLPSGLSLPRTDTSKDTDNDSGPPGSAAESEDEGDAATKDDPVLPIIPDNILAFRMITSMLSKIQQEMPFTVLDSKEDNTSREERYQLRLLNAFSVIAVLDYQVTAAVLKRHSNERQEVILFSISSSPRRV